MDVIELLCGELSPTVEQLKSLVKIDSGHYMSVYFLVVEVLDSEDEFRHYIGSATEQVRGFGKRRQQYFRLAINQLPFFIKDLDSKGKKFRIVCVVPLLRIFREENNDLVFGDMRVPIYLIETLIMIWTRIFKKGGELEKIMDYSPWTADETLLIRSNRIPSTAREWPKGMVKTEEEVEAYNQMRREQNNTRVKNNRQRYRPNKATREAAEAARAEAEWEAEFLGDVYL